MSCEIYNKIEFPVREAVVKLNRLNIQTNSSEGGGNDNHAAPHFAYIEAKLSSENLIICQYYNFILDKIYSFLGPDDLLFNQSAKNYAKKTGFYIIGLYRKNLCDTDVIFGFKSIINKLKMQEYN